MFTEQTAMLLETLQN